MRSDHEPTTARLGGPDWNLIWMAMKDRQQATPGFLSGTEFFGRAENVARYLRLTAARHDGYTERQLASMAIPGGATVLDIGAGPGTLAVPLAQRGCRVTAVEPSAPMRRLLREYAGHEAVTVAIIEDPWERIDPDFFTGPFDIVIASHSLMMVDLRAALEKMHAVCSGRVHVFWPLTPPGGREIEQALWTTIHGAAYPPEPMADCIWNVLFQMGIMATLEAEFDQFEYHFGDLDEAMDEFRYRLNCPDGAETVLRFALNRLLPRSADGDFRLDRSRWNAAIHWNVRGQSVSCGVGTRQ